MISSIPVSIRQEIERETDSQILDFSFCSGGCINHGGKLATTRATWFLKWNDQEKFPGMFFAEARGLALLGAAGGLKVPAVVMQRSAGSFQFLLLEYIEQGARATDYWRSFGERLAALHRRSASGFGLDHDNYIGSLPQQNTPSASWPEFFVERRLRIQLRLAYDAGKLDRGVMEKFERLFASMPSLIPEEPPALLHGDLWSGNIMATRSGDPCLIDPAAYYGHREMDLAMTRLFGGFDPSFLAAYENTYPLSPGYEERFDLCNLYPLLVHVNLFGGGYGSQVVSILRQFV